MPMLLMPQVADRYEWRILFVTRRARPGHRNRTHKTRRTLRERALLLRPANNAAARGAKRASTIASGGNIAPRRIGKHDCESYNGGLAIRGAAPWLAHRSDQSVSAIVV